MKPAIIEHYFAPGMEPGTCTMVISFIHHPQERVIFIPILQMWLRDLVTGKLPEITSHSYVSLFLSSILSPLCSQSLFGVAWFHLSHILGLLFLQSLFGFDKNKLQVLPFGYYLSLSMNLRTIAIRHSLINCRQ